MNPHQRFSASIKELLLSQWRNRQMIRVLTKREISLRYRGSALGLAWSFLNPLLMLAIYTFIFSVVFDSRWGAAVENKAYFAMVLFAGLIVYNIFSECINRAPSLIVNNSNYVKKVVFPLEILPMVALGSALFHGFVSLLVLLVAQLVFTQTMPWTILLFPALLLPLLLSVMGLLWLLSALGVYVRDIGQTTPILTSLLMFLSPLFYPVSAVPDPYRFWLKLNPLAFIIEQSRNVLIFGRLPDWSDLTVALLVSTLIAASGFWWFQRTRRGFADVI
jgi:lipopolysaccharide transport system permease protein